MSEPAWLPRLLLLEDCGGDAKRYIETVYGEFHRDFIQRQPQFQGRWVRCRRDPIYDGKEAGFWHCISEGPTEDERVPAPRRMERVRWVRAIIEHADDPSVCCWETETSMASDRRWCIWYGEEFLVILAARQRKRDGFRYWQLITAYDTLEEHRKAKLRREYQEWRARNG